jgi:hypothetical protein
VAEGSAGIALVLLFAENWAKLTNTDQLHIRDITMPAKRAEDGGRMLRSWRRGAIVALVAGAAIAAQLVAISPALAAGPTVSITATSKFKVTNDVFVVYHIAAFDKATIHGTVKGGAAGEVATLFAQQFPFKKVPVKAGTVTLKGGTATYSFTVTPTLYTKYSVRLFASKTATKTLASSGTQILYVASDQSFSNPSPANCARPVCHESLTVDTFVPGSALGYEMGKHDYPYFGANFNATKVPPPPSWVYLNGGHAAVTKARKLSATEFQNKLTFSFTIGNNAANWIGLFCTKDNVYKDGLGLPGSHGCGSSRISTSTPYVG